MAKYATTEKTIHCHYCNLECTLLDLIEEGGKSCRSFSCPKCGGLYMMEMSGMATSHALPEVAFDPSCFDDG